MSFKVGDTVQLKSGSPCMTVSGADSEMVVCVWFDNKGQQQNGAFKPDMLTECDEDPVSVPTED